MSMIRKYHNHKLASILRSDYVLLLRMHSHVSTYMVRKLNYIKERNVLLAASSLVCTILVYSSVRTKVDTLYAHGVHLRYREY